MRCVFCGSTQIILEEKKEGYNIKTGIVGTALVGLPGALAGLNGKKTTYYHCKACGKELNYCMSQTEESFLNDMLANPIMWKESLVRYKKEYSNIEWDEGKEITSQPDNIKMSDSDLLFQEMLKDLSNQSMIKQDVFHYKYFQSDKYDLSAVEKAINNLIKSEKMIVEVVNDISYYKLVISEDDKNEAANQRKRAFAREHAKVVFKDNFIYFKEQALSFLDHEKTYSFDELTECLTEMLKDFKSDNNEFFVDYLVREIRMSLRKRGIIVSVGEHEFKLQTPEEREAKERERLEELHKPIKEPALKLLNNNVKKYTVSDMQGASKELEVFSNQKIAAVLARMVENKEIEIYEVGKKRYYSQIGYGEKVQARKTEINTRLKELSSELSSIQASMENIDETKELTSANRELSEAKISLESLGLLKFKEKNILKEKILSLENQITILKSKQEVAIKPYRDNIVRLENEKKLLSEELTNI